MYVLGFVSGYLILKKRRVFSLTQLDSLIFAIFLGVILGGRLGYVLFYDLPYYLTHPLDVFKTWQWWMAFHGAVIGVILAMIYFAKKQKLNFYAIADQITSILPIGLGLGRIGNYINKELLGMPYTGFLAVQKNGHSFFPSPLLESFLEWIVLWCIVSYVLKHKKRDGQVAGVFLFFYGIFRFSVEFVRTPDIQLGYLFGNWLTMGQVLSIPMILAGMYFWLLRKKQNASDLSTK